ncbi:MAG: hypothetical protein EBV89_01515 [Betaproteobacteria bacterium]|nr:hypothetical protein [Betaproteobacteria bacterium]
MTLSLLEQDLRERMAERILVLDGAMGTMIQRYRLSEAHFRGEQDFAHVSERPDAPGARL